MVDVSRAANVSDSLVRHYMRGSRSVSPAFLHWLALAEAGQEPRPQDDAAQLAALSERVARLEGQMEAMLATLRVPEPEQELPPGVTLGKKIFIGGDARSAPNVRTRAKAP